MEVARKIKAEGGTKAQISVLKEVLAFENADRNRLFGEALPAGLRLICE